MITRGDSTRKPPKSAEDPGTHRCCVSQAPLLSKVLFYLAPGTSPKDKNFNLPRLCIRKFFPKKKCFIFDRPAHRRKLGQLETLHDDELDSEFVQQAASFCSYIFHNSKIKTLPGGIQVNGPRESSSQSSHSLLRLKECGIASSSLQFGKCKPTVITGYTVGDTACLMDFISQVSWIRKNRKGQRQKLYCLKLP